MEHGVRYADGVSTWLAILASLGNPGVFVLPRYGPGPLLTASKF